MGIFRNSLFNKVMTVFTTVVFVNMSFFLAEVNALKLNKDKQMFANIVKLISSSAAEEEKDIFGGTDEDFAAKEIDLIFNYSIHSVNGYITSLNKKGCTFIAGIPRLGIYEIFSPPPES